jgi:hypothetical protein
MSGLKKVQVSDSSKHVNESHRCEISGFHRAVDVVFPLLSCYAEYVRSCLQKFRCISSVLEYGTDKLSRNIGKEQ